MNRKTIACLILVGSLLSGCSNGYEGWTAEQINSANQAGYAMAAQANQNAGQALNQATAAYSPVGVQAQPQTTNNGTIKCITAGIYTNCRN